MKLTITLIAFTLIAILIPEFISAQPGLGFGSQLKSDAAISTLSDPVGADRLIDPLFAIHFGVVYHLFTKSSNLERVNS